MTKTKVVPLRIPETLDSVAALRAELEHTDKATALGQWLHNRAEQDVLKTLSEGRISIGRAAELLDVSIYDIHALIQLHGVEVGPSDEQLEYSRKTMKKLSLARKP
jgi:predicted HTH domain antitoxin